MIGKARRGAGRGSMVPAALTLCAAVLQAGGTTALLIGGRSYPHQLTRASTRECFRKHDNGSDTWRLQTIAPPTATHTYIMDQWWGFLRFITTFLPVVQGNELFAIAKLHSSGFLALPSPASTMLHPRRAAVGCGVHTLPPPSHHGKSESRHLLSR